MNTPFYPIYALFDVRDNDGYDDGELAVFASFGDIPKILHEYYATLGKIYALNHTQNTLLTSNQVRWSCCQNYLVFYTENQLACAWGIKKQDLTQDNPPVYVSTDEHEWKLDSKSLSDFLNAMAHLQAVFGLDDCSCAFIWFHTQSDLINLQNSFTKKPFGLLSWCNGVDFYGNAQEVIAVFHGEYFSYACQNHVHFLQMSAVLDKLGKS